MEELFLLSMVLGVVAGFLAGLFGLGGGVVIVPALIWMFTSYNYPNEVVVIMAVATSLATIIFTSIAALITHYKLGAIKWGSVIRLAPGILLGAGAGAIIAEHIEAGTLKWFFVVYLIYTGIRMAVPQKTSGKIKLRRYWLDYGAGGVIGFISAILGIGGGTLTVPYLLSRDLPMKNAVAVSSACGLPIAISGTVTYVLLGWANTYVPEWSFGYVNLPVLAGVVVCSIVTAPAGAKLANRLPAQKLKRYFSIVLFLIALKMGVG